jgi:uncharacterized membrane protein
MITGLVFLALGLYLTLSSLRLPSGPGFFPRTLGVLMVLLAVAALRDRHRAASIENRRTIAATLALTVLYLLLWGTGGFALKTGLYLLLLLRLYGQPWRPAVTVSLVLTALVTLGFQFGLRLTLE